MLPNFLCLLTLLQFLEERYFENLIKLSLFHHFYDRLEAIGVLSAIGDVSQQLV